MTKFATRNLPLAPLGLVSNPRQCHQDLSIGEFHMAEQGLPQEQVWENINFEKHTEILYNNTNLMQII